MGSAFTPTFNVSEGSVSEAMLAPGATLKLGTEQASTSGTAIDFTGIPAGTKQIIVTFEGVSTNGTSDLLVQIGDSGGVENTGYSSLGTRTSSGGTAQTASTAGFSCGDNASAASTLSGQLVLTLKDPANFTWTATCIFYDSTPTMMLGAGVKSLSAELDRVRITSASTDTFDAGSINIAYK